MVPSAGAPCRRGWDRSARLWTMALSIGCLTIDARDCQALGGFWSQALGWTIVESTAAGVYLVPPEAAGKDTAVPGLFLFPSPDAKVGKNRVHLDLRPDDQPAEIQRLEALGATRVDIGQSGDEAWIVMADPEGNEFCVLTSR
jgi:predicted enzyme related to lactoylglutathione lyase